MGHYTLVNQRVEKTISNKIFYMVIDLYRLPISQISWIRLITLFSIHFNSMTILAKPFSHRKLVADDHFCNVIMYKCHVYTFWELRRCSYIRGLFTMMTSSNGNIFRVTCHLAGNSLASGEFPAQSQWRIALMFSLICVWINGWVNREAGDLRRYRAHYDVTVMTD